MISAIKYLFTRKYTEKIPKYDVSLDSVGYELKGDIENTFGKSLAIRVVDSGSDCSTEIELVNLLSPYYDIERFGISIVASPRHADLLIVTGSVTHNMKSALLKTYEAMPAPKFVVALGDDACDGGILKGSYAINDGLDSILPVDLKIWGDPPTPIEILNGLVNFMKKISNQQRNIESSMLMKIILFCQMAGMGFLFII